MLLHTVFFQFMCISVWSSFMPFGVRGSRARVAVSLCFWHCYSCYCFLLACSPQLTTDKYPIAFHIKSHQFLFRYCLLPLRPCSTSQSNTWVFAQLNTRYKGSGACKPRDYEKHLVDKDSLPSQGAKKHCGSSKAQRKKPKSTDNIRALLALCWEGAQKRLGLSKWPFLPLLANGQKDSSRSFRRRRC